MVRRLAALLLMNASLDVNYLTVKGAAYTWPSVEITAEHELNLES